MTKVVEETLGELTEVVDEVAQDNRRLDDNEIEQAYANLSFRVIYQTNNYFLPQLHTLIENREVINIRPEYQRRLRWSTKQKSLLIESLLLNIPIPPVFFYESDLARYEVMDGQQRLNAVHEFLSNKFSLAGVEKLPFINAKRYQQLPPKLKRGLDRASFSAIVLLQESQTGEDDPYLVRRYVFERLNTGGQKLNPQEMRNSIFRGSFNDMIVALARNSDFCKIFDIPEYTETDENEYYESPARQKNSLYRRMGDCQIVLRFFALLDDEYIKGSMRSILDSCMKRNKDASAQKIVELEAVYSKLIHTCDQLFSSEAFLLPPDEKGNRRISVALYDAIMVALYRRQEHLSRFIQRRSFIAEKIQQLLVTRLELLTGKANTAQSIRDRISEITSVLDAVPQ